MSTADIILKILDGLVAASDIYVEIEALQQKIATMQTEGRDPTDEEWDQLLASIDADKARIDAADKRLNP
jgi:cell fate (sporulation/competence/biofilm development) regulator YlbF (YheA/YmcA/DUF963 family)